MDSNSFEKINRFLVLFTAFTTVLACIMGLFLSMEGDATNLMTLHKWIGVAISFFIYGLVFIKKERVFKTVLYIGFIGVIFAGHYGAGLTHGTNFITEPLKKVKVVEITQETPIFLGFVKPILDAKCVGCHNPEKQKGELDMTSFNTMVSGGKHGALWTAGSTEESALLRRVHLPLEHKEHMPPEGKKQLTKEEIRLLSLWIKNGANENISLVQLPENDTLGLEVSKHLERKTQKKTLAYNFDFARKKDVDALKNPYRTVIQKSPSSPAIEVVIHGKQTYAPELLTDLSKIKKQIVSLNLSFLPIDKGSMEFIGTMTNLEELILNFTDLKTEDLESLKTCSNLRTLSLSGTQVDSNISDIIKVLPKLSRAFIWNTTINEEEIKVLKTTFPEIYFETGFQDSENKLTLTPPRLLSKSTVISKDDYIVLGHKMPEVEIRYTTDGTEPNDSSLLYKNPIKIDLKSKLPIKTIALKKNWLPSPVKTYKFFDKGYLPEKFELVYQGIQSEFIGEAGIILTDNNIGNSNDIRSSAYWATFNKQKPLNATAYFEESSPKIKEIVFSYGINYWQKKEPLESLEVWAGYHKDSLKLIKQVKRTYRKINKEKEGSYRSVVVKIPKAEYRFYKIIAIPFKKEKLYVDQLFFY
ncbi:FN3 associated domain-containing protein [Seonamhaeicola sp.]|uniref:FN3 associated domain-containing protein n=1 Tax=Seonamhaeicola sp. TaxID=1912245 RepID=UPI00260D0D83|nr:FN3 associated domain-containing protein [Seonamhaeicola sp.]